MTTPPRTAATSWRATLWPDRMPERLTRCIVGLALFGLGISMFLAARLGLAPWDILHQGISRKTGLSVGMVIEIVGVLILLAWIPMRLRPGLGTILNAIEIGLVVALISDRLPHTDNLVLRLAYIAGGLLAVGAGSGLYIGAGLGTGPRDGLMIGVSQRGVSIRVARTIVEIGVMVAGVLMGGDIGLGTVVFMLGIGPCVQFFMSRLHMRGAPVTHH